jgi:hypothetical protein
VELTLASLLLKQSLVLQVELTLALLLTAARRVALSSYYGFAFWLCKFDLDVGVDAWFELFRLCACWMWWHCWVGKLGADGMDMLGAE